MVGVLLVAASFAGCGDETPLGAPGCDSSGVVLIAQSVPGAERVPCWEELPGGWTVREVDIGSSGTAVGLDSDRAGSDAAEFSYQQSCDVAGLGRLPSEWEDVTVHEAIRSLAGGLDADRYFVFAGGCVRVTFAFEEFDDLTHAEALIDSFDLIERTAITERLQEQSEDFLLR